MSNLYEGMFLLDNDVVRGGWDGAKAQVTDLLTKHGATLHTARRWDERRLAYKIKGRARATYLLCCFDLPTENGAALTRDLELRESVLRHLIVRTDAVPVTERELAEAEKASDFVVPPPPADEVPATVSESSDDSDEEPRPRRKRPGTAKDEDSGDTQTASPKTETATATATEDEKES